MLGVMIKQTMKYLIYIFLVLLSICSCQKSIENNYPQYYRTYNQVLKLEKEGKFREAFDLFQEAESAVDFVPVQHLLKARSMAVELEDCSQVLEYFQKAVNNGFEYEEYTFQNDVCPKVNNSTVEGIEIDYEYRNLVKAIFQKDQAVRRGEINEDMASVDSLNIQLLLDLINEKGYPSPKLVGSKVSGNAFIILLHFDSDIGNVKLKSILDNAFNEGMISPGQYAWIIDRRRYWGPQKLDPYYYQLPIEKYFDMSKEEIAIIDVRRDSIGLKPLAEMNITKTENGGMSIEF